MEFMELRVRTVGRPGRQPFVSLIGTLSTRVFETPTATGREHFACEDRLVSQIRHLNIVILLISNRENILSNVNVVV